MAEYNEWIDVKKRLPCIGDEVIVTICDDSGDTPWLYTTVGWYAMEGNRWVVDNEFNTRVTHWMPMPKPFSLSKNRVSSVDVKPIINQFNNHPICPFCGRDLQGVIDDGENA